MSFFVTLEDICCKLVFIDNTHLQIFRALAYIHGIGVCHRDIKPQNLLVCIWSFRVCVLKVYDIDYCSLLWQVNPHTHQLKLCDFGSAKVLVIVTCNIKLVPILDSWLTAIMKNLFIYSVVDLHQFFNLEVVSNVIFITSSISCRRGLLNISDLSCKPGMIVVVPHFLR